MENEIKTKTNAASAAFKRMLSIVLALIMLLSITAGIDLSAYAVTSGDYKFEYNILSNGTAEITGYYGTDENVLIPATIDGYSVTSIGNYAFSGCSVLKFMEIENNVTSIGDYAFDNCESLNSIEIPNSVLSIGNFVFRNCECLMNIIIPNNITSIGGYAFYNCKNLTSITIPNCVTSIGNYAFNKCSELLNVFYNGSINKWNSINIAPYNVELKNAIINCFDGLINCKHMWNAGKVTKTPTCTAAGVKTYTCTTCGETKTETIPATGHKAVADKAVVATCTKAGKTAG